MFLAAVGLPRCLADVPTGSWGLRAEAFELISPNGAGPEDRSVDVNDDMWSMAYSRLGGDPLACGYVDTGDDMIGVIHQGITAVLGSGEPGDIDARPREIRRHCGDMSHHAWVAALDYCDVPVLGRLCGRSSW